MKENKLKAAVPVLISAALMLAIFVFSSQNGAVSSRISLYVSRRFAKLIFLDFGGMSSQTQDLIVSELHGFVRKFAHFTIYALLGFNIFAAAHVTAKKLSKQIGLTLVICSVYAAADEIHQLFVYGRAGSARDVIIDVCGSACGIIAALIYFATVYYVKSRRKGKNAVDT